MSNSTSVTVVAVDPEGRIALTETDRSTDARLGETLAESQEARARSALINNLIRAQTEPALGTPLLRHANGPNFIRDVLTMFGWQFPVLHLDPAAPAPSADIEERTATQALARGAAMIEDEEQNGPRS